MKETILEDLLIKFLNSKPTKSIMGTHNDIDVISEIKVKVPEGDFYHPPVYIKIIVNFPDLWYQNELMIRNNIDGRYWEDLIIPDILVKYFPDDCNRVCFVKIVSNDGITLFPESCSSVSQYNNF
jgi:hypothetical protein